MPGDILEQGDAVHADAAADLDILIADGLGIITNGHGKRGFVGRLGDMQDALDGPAQVDGCRA